MERELIELTVFAVLGRWDDLAALRGRPGVRPDRRWREALLQTHLFAGFPRIVEAFGVLGRAGGLGQPDPDETLAEPDLPERGRALFDRIYGSRADRVRAELQGHHADFAAWVEGHAYGRVLTRPGLPAAQRELLAVAALTALGQDRQLASHARGAVACGADPEEVHGVVEAVAPHVDPHDLERARKVVARFAPLDGRQQP
ncbi:Carboxymuconolactone decarboxylase family protein [Planctomycetes bacterium Pla86]|uniref:Carboxymuconolactone decarboxylase family protein n=1 Tax=Engelhardtia mirabilis TaxID=2528011 RepID=A0A518BPP8_9BACT|nr:Carboxymuconolactone decarboxylase family protein [Planctomycetes bacterium Pla133]QDV03230.1 Carboxymuconolactone decarboxylase family protein [Planctomycetes bacterium Pla86]